MNGISRAILLWRAWFERKQGLTFAAWAKSKFKRANELETRAGTRPKGQNDGQPERDRSR